MRIDVSTDNIAQTLAILQKGGQEGTECVVLWLAQVSGARIRVQEVYSPVHRAKSDMFWITEAGMDELKARLRETHTMVAAQVHTHPGRAFHSEADDRWAIVRHEGALSIVLPRFALETSVLTFDRDVKVYRLNEDDRWCQIGPDRLPEHLCRS
jgi:hypothetical protein